MAIVDVFVPDLYFGRPGALTTLPWPLDGVPRPATRSTSEFVTGSGASRVGKLLRAPKAYELRWSNLRYDTFAKVEAYHLGHMGVGPWAFVDPSSINMLTVNQASATSDRNSVQGFSTLGQAGNGALSSNANAAHIHRAGAPRSMRWLFATTPNTFPVWETLSVYSGWKGIPVVPGKQYTFSAWIKPDGTVDSSVLLSIRIEWFDAASVSISDSSSGDQTVTAWQRLTAIGTAPSNAAYALLKAVAWGSTITTGASIYLDEMQFEMNSAATDWRPGNGVYPVEILSLADAVPWAATWRSGPQLMLREVA